MQKDENLTEVVLRYRGYNDAIAGEKRPEKAGAAYWEGYNLGSEVRHARRGGKL